MVDGREGLEYPVDNLFHVVDRRERVQYLADNRMHVMDVKKRGGVPGRYLAACVGQGRGV